MDKFCYDHIGFKRIIKETFMEGSFSDIVCMYHPTRIFLVDDNRNFLETIELILSNLYSVKTCTNPERALSLLESCHDDINNDLFTLVDGEESDSAINHRFDIELGNLYRLVYEPARFDSMSVVIVDYAMPEMSGLEFCRKIKEQKIRKIMLTAEDDKAMAIQAFNDGIIDKFILKDDPQLQVKLIKAIDELQKNYFEQLSKPIKASFSNQLHPLFSDKDYKKLFNDVYHKAGAVEFYLVDSQGSFLFLDDHAKPTWLILRDKKTLQDQLQLLGDYDVPGDVLRSLENQQSMLCLVGEADYKKPLEYWIKSIYPMNKLNENYFYSVIEDKLTCSIEWDNVVVNEKAVS